MVGDFRFDLNRSEVEAMEHDMEAAALMQDVGDEVADLAAELAPKDTGEGAESIHAEVDEDADSVYADVSWDRDHFYMGFKELGTEHEPATPFLRPALDQTKI